MKRTNTLTLLILACLTAIPSIAQARYRDGMNLYEYVRSSPTNHVDPMGLGVDYDNMTKDQQANAKAILTQSLAKNGARGVRRARTTDAYHRALKGEKPLEDGQEGPLKKALLQQQRDNKLCPAGTTSRRIKGAGGKTMLLCFNQTDPLACKPQHQERLVKGFVKAAGFIETTLRMDPKKRRKKAVYWFHIRNKDFLKKVDSKLQQLEKDLYGKPITVSCDTKSTTKTCKEDPRRPAWADGTERKIVFCCDFLKGKEDSSRVVLHEVTHISLETLDLGIYYKRTPPYMQNGKRVPGLGFYYDESTKKHVQPIGDHLTVPARGKRRAWGSKQYLRHADTWSPFLMGH